MDGIVIALMLGWMWIQIVWPTAPFSYLRARGAESSKTFNEYADLHRALARRK